MVSPFVRRRRLAAELRALREEREMTADDLAKDIHYSRMKISRLENAHGRPDVADVITILNTLGVSDKRWKEIVSLAHEASAKGWWDSFGDAMGARQRLYADIESGAATIREYNDTSLPGLLQTPEFIDALVKLKRAEGALDFSPKRMAEARRRRQEAVLRPDGPTLDIILDEVVVRRINVPIGIMAAQTRYLVNLMTSEPRLEVRVLPVDARIEGISIPRSAFFLYTFSNPVDPPLAVVETPSTDLVYSEATEVEQHIKRYELLSKAVLSSKDSLSCLAEAADRLTREAGSDG
ncbi:helix-turn-helix domain-containing protein [Actinomadura rubrisoli]|uniref:XRE family transcriptional regulator n=1 Tax=Actinomadura rubrisoli TaxID=2530368 RepID=A0A4R5APC1_9ACTN|nr:Scr1 family TA system antitoxin-like transcriptional regulator [Actinomadura rubrisoli]TDD74483.1 XRE family transcriptional regulator [Actinomadura rubrisoli]